MHISLVVLLFYFMVDPLNYNPNKVYKLHLVDML